MGSTTIKFNRLVPIVACVYLQPALIRGGLLLPKKPSFLQLRKPNTHVRRFAAMGSTTSDSNRMEYGPKKQSKVFAPSRFVTDEEGKKWRLCAGAAVLNSDNHLLVGERIHIANAWQAPQGGVDDVWEENDHEAETVVDAACREMYEEMGLVNGKHVMLEPVGGDGPKPLRYETKGTRSWLTKSGFAGQELHWTIFRCMDGRGDQHASAMCELNGMNGEEAEFAQVKWEPIESVVENMWPAKRAPYESLRDAVQPIIQDWDGRCTKLDFTGKWSRDTSTSTGVVEGLLARGMSRDKAETEAKKPYIQTWARGTTDSTTWRVTTFDVDDKTVRRELDYKVGTWQEKFEGDSVLVGTLESTVQVERRTAFVAEPEADFGGLAHSTISRTPLGIEEARRYLKGDKLLLRRTFWPKQGDCSVSTEVFVRDQQ